jgi:hypothetical protein
MPRLSPVSVTILDGAVVLSRRSESAKWQARFKVDNRWIRITTKEKVGALDLGRVAFLVPKMATLKSEHPLLAVRAREDRSGWYVEAWWTNRPSENIGHFATQSEARNWITLESTSYFVLREIESMIKHAEQSLS